MSRATMMKKATMLNRAVIINRTVIGALATFAGIAVSTASVAAEECLPENQRASLVQHQLIFVGPLDIAQEEQKNRQPAIRNGKQQLQPFGEANSAWQRLKTMQQAGGDIYAAVFPGREKEQVVSPTAVDAYVVLRNDCAVGLFVTRQTGKLVVEANSGTFEKCIPMQPGSEMHYSFKASAPLDFNLHYHVGDEVVYPALVKGIDQKKGVFRPDKQQFYCLMWQNRASSPVELTVEFDVR